MYRWFSCDLSSDEISVVNQYGKATVIYELEVMAAVLAVVTLGSSWKSADVVLFCDNEAALAALVSGKTDSPFVSFMLDILQEWEERCDVKLWCERVPSHSNPSDAPSRGQLDGLQPSMRLDPDIPGHLLRFACGHEKSDLGVGVFSI